MNPRIPSSWGAAGWHVDERGELAITEDDEPDTDDCPTDFQKHVLHHLHRIEQQMTEFASDQAHLDADVASLGQVTASIETEISNLKQQPNASSLDFTGLDAALATLRTVAPSAPATGAPTPAPAEAPVPVDAPADVPVDSPPAA